MFKAPDNIQENFRAAMMTTAAFKWEISATRYYIGNSTVYIMQPAGIGRQIYIEPRDQMDGSISWVVIMTNFVLGKDGRYHYEPNPSSRTDEFIKNTRFQAKGDALEHLIKFERKHQDKSVDAHLNEDTRLYFPSIM